jgi:tetratricopeptide (TPR) repeat protein
MARCWTCGTKWEQSAGELYICEACEDISAQVRSLEKTERTKLSKIDDLIYVQRKGFDSLGERLSEIASTIEWGFSELSWELQQQTSVLREMTKILKTPNETKANEWRQMGEELRRRGVYDEAIEFFSKSIRTNPLDYRTYIGLGNTYLHIRKFREAKKYFEKSLPHSPNNFYKSYSLRLIGRICYCMEDYGHAIKSLKEAVDLSPSYAEAQYDLAQYYGIVGDAKKALPPLTDAIKKNSFYFYLSEKERNFNPIRREVIQLQEEMKKEAYTDAVSVISSAKKNLEDAEKRFDQLHVRKENSKIWTHLKLAIEKASSGDYKSILEAKPTARKVIDSAVTSKDKAPQVEELQKLMRERFRSLNLSTFLHLSFLVCFILTFLVSGWFYLLGAFFEGLAFSSWNWEFSNDTIDSGLFFTGFIFAPLTFFSIVHYFSSSRWIKESYEAGLNAISVFDDIAKNLEAEREAERYFEELCKEDFSENEDEETHWIR